MNAEELSGTGLIATGITLVTSGASVAQGGSTTTGLIMIGAGAICVATGVFLMQKGITGRVVQGVKLALGR
jgi:hypothetical protein